MSDTDRNGEQGAPDREGRQATSGASDDREGDAAGSPATSEAPAGDASEAAEQFSREEGEAPSG